MISSKVDLNESIKVVGKSLIKPTVSTNRRFTFFKKDFLIVESRDANNISFDKTLDLVNLLNRVDFPELVYPTRELQEFYFFFFYIFEYLYLK